MAAPPSPRPPKAHSAGGDASVSVFLDTDLGTRLALLVAADTTVRHLKSQVAAEHVAAFPDLGPVAVKSFQVHRKGALYHLSDSMTVTSAFTRIKGGCFLHVKMAEAAAAATHCCQGAPATYGRSSSEGRLQKHVRELPAATSEISRDALPLRLGGADDAAVLNNVHAHDAVPNDVLLPPSSQMNTERKNNEALGMVSDADVDKSPKQTNMSHVVEEVHGKEDILHGDGDHDVGGGVADNKQVRIQEEMLGEIHALDDLSNAEERKKAKRNDPVHTSAADPRITSEPDTRDMTKSIRAPLETNTTSHVELSNTSFQQEAHSLQQENPNTVGKKKKRKRRQLAPSEAVCAQETTKSPTGAVELSKSTGDGAYNVELTSRDETEVRASVLLSSLELNDGTQGGKPVQFGSDALASTNVIYEQGNFDHVHKGYRNPSIADAINYTAEVLASDGGEKLEKIKRHKHNEESHDEGVAETSNMEKDGENTDASEKRHTNNTSQEKKRKKAKKVSSVDMAPMDTAAEKEMRGYRENAAKSDKISTEREIFHDPSMQQISSNVQQRDSNIIENPSGDGKRKKRRRRHTESSKGADPSPDLIKSSEFVTNESSLQHTKSAPLDAKQTTEGGIEGATVSDHQKLGESLDIAAADVIDEVLADLKSKGSSSKDLDGDLLTGQTHLGSNPDALELPESSGDKVGISAAPLKYRKAIHSDAPGSSPSHKKSKGKQLKVLSTRKKTSLKQVPTDNGKAIQSSDEQVNRVTNEDMKGANATQENLVQGGSVIDTPSSTVAKVQQKGKRSSKTRAPKIQETNHSSHGQDSHLAKDSQDENAIGITGTHDNENAAGDPTESPVDQKDATTLKSSSPNARKERKKSSNTELQSQDSALEHGPTADLVDFRAEKGMVSPKSSADAVEPNHHIVVHPASDSINFLDHFSSGEMNDPSVSAENKQNNEDGTIREVKNKKKNKRKQGTGSIEPNDLLGYLCPMDKTSLTDHFGTSEVVVPSVTVENMNREYENVKSGKEKKKRKRKPNLEGPEKENLNGDHHGTDIGTQDSLQSVVQKGRMGQDDGNENNNKVTQDVSITQQEPEDVTCDRTLEKKLHQSYADNQKKLPIDKDNSHITNELRKSTSQKKPHAKSSNLDESINGRVGQDPKAVSNLVKSFSMSPPASSDSAEGTPLNANRYRLAVRKVPRKRYEQTSEKSKKESTKVGSGAIFNDAISEGSDDAVDTKREKAAMETSSDNSSTSADSGISSAAYDESEVPDDDGSVSLSQKSLKEGLHIGSILRGSSSYKKARQKQTEQLDDDTEVPDSQPPDGLWG